MDDELTALEERMNDRFAALRDDLLDGFRDSLAAALSGHGWVVLVASTAAALGLVVLDAVVSRLT
jgi:superoxide dismutase